MTWKSERFWVLCERSHLNRQVLEGDPGGFVFFCSDSNQGKGLSEGKGGKEDT